MHTNFTPYVKKKNIEGVSFNFFIGDTDGRDWYDIYCTDPIWAEMRFIRDNLVEEGDVVFECGGHHGCTAIPLATWVGEKGKVITFEPKPSNVEIIKKNIELNKISNITVLNKAVGSKNGRTYISDASNASVQNSSVKGAIEVDVVALDDFIKLQPAFLKIDVEGYEVEVLKGARQILQNRPKLAIEIHTETLSSYRTNVQELLNLLHLENYECWIQWKDEEDPEKFDVHQEITARVHLFALPKQINVLKKSQAPILSHTQTSEMANESSLNIGSLSPSLAGNNAVSEISIITPTLNRAEFLKWSIQSFIAQEFPPEKYEIVVVDNGSTDSTRQVVETFITANKSHTIRYIYEPEPGLLSGRHRGALEAKGEILAYTDDDTEANPKWLATIASAFEDPNVHLVGGPSLPKFETMPPIWMRPYFSLNGEHLSCGTLSLIDLGHNILEIDPCQVYGLNYSIRKKTLFDLGGFNPDCIPKHLQHFQGDGETGLSIKIREKGYKSIYHPGAMVYHLIPSNRLTVEYFEKWHFYWGVCDSYTNIRKSKTVNGISDLIFNPNAPNIPKYSPFENDYIRIHKAYFDGYNFHLNAVRRHPKLLEWVLRENYFDYKLPEVGISDSQTHAAEPRHDISLKQNEDIVKARIEFERFSDSQKTLPLPWTREYYVFRDRFSQNILGNQYIHKIFNQRLQLPEKYGVGVDERCIEYPWFFAVADPKAHEYLDAGGALNHAFVINNPHWSGKKLTILTLAPDGNFFSNPWLEYKYADLRQIPYDDNFFDEIACISTLEHVGMDNVLYTKDKKHKEYNVQDFERALQELRRVLKPEGRLLLTVPFGKYQNWGEFQQFDKELLERAADVFGALLKDERFFRYTNTGWKLSQGPEECRNLSYARTAVEMQWGAKSTGLPGEADGAVAARAVACCIWK